MPNIKPSHLYMTLPALCRFEWTVFGVSTSVIVSVSMSYVYVCGYCMFFAYELL